MIYLHVYAYIYVWHGVQTRAREVYPPPPPPWLWRYTFMNVVAYQITGISTVCSITTKKSSQLPICEGSISDRGFPSQRASNTESISVWWRHHVLSCCRVSASDSYFGEDVRVDLTDREFSDNQKRYCKCEQDPHTRVSSTYGSKRVSTYFPGGYGCNLISQSSHFHINIKVRYIYILNISCEIALIWIPQDLIDNWSTLVQLMTWRRQATRYYMS